MKNRAEAEDGHVYGGRCMKNHGFSASRFVFGHIHALDARAQGQLEMVVFHCITARVSGRSILQLKTTSN